MWTFEQWRDKFLENEAALINEGLAILRAHDQNVQAALKQARVCAIPTGSINASQVRELRDNEQLTMHEAKELLLAERPRASGLAANAPSFLASDLGHELANKSGTFGLVWSMAGDGQVHCSLRSNGEYDVSAIAKAFGGGGHRNAAGFSTDIDTLMSWLK